MIRKIRFNSIIHDVTSWSSKLAIHILPNISRIKGNQTMKLGLLIEYNREIFFLKNHVENEAERLVPDLFFEFCSFNKGSVASF